jgi:hypothetical protein
MLQGGEKNLNHIKQITYYVWQDKHNNIIITKQL